MRHGFLQQFAEAEAEARQSPCAVVILDTLF